MPDRVDLDAGNGRRRLVRTALALVLATAVWDLAECGVSIGAGIRAHSLALVAFGLDSAIELAATGTIFHRLRLELSGAGEEAVERAERRAGRIVGATFLLLAAYVVLAGAWSLWRGELASESPLGIAVAGAALVVMPLLAWAKLRVAARLGSEALRAEARESLACAFLSLTVLLGLVAVAAFGWHRADAIAAFVMVPWLVREGLEGVRGEED